MPQGGLVGREHEVRLVESLINSIPTRGGLSLELGAESVLLIRGEPGIGKTALLEVAATEAERSEIRVLRVAGVQSEASLPYAGLQQLLRGLGQRIELLPRPQRTAISAALGIGDGDAAPFLVGLAALNLLAEAASAKPLLLLADDAQWLDRPSGDTLAFLARRIGSEPIGLLIAARAGHDLVFAGAGLPELGLGPLARSPAEQLLEIAAPALDRERRAQLLEGAAGNPLALIEMPKALSDEGMDPGSPLPLTDRLKRAFLRRDAELPEVTRTLLLIAAASEGARVEEVLAAAALRWPEAGVDDLAPAADAGLVEIRDAVVAFRHPLIRSAIYGAADDEARRRVHAALAEAPAVTPESRAWHRAAAALGEDEEVAAELDLVAEDSLRRGAPSIAFTALRRAAALGGAGRRASRLLQAAELAFELGRADLVEDLVSRLGRLELSRNGRARMVLVRESFTDGVPGDAIQVQALVATARDAAAADPGLSLDLLHGAALRCWWADPGGDSREAVAAAAEVLGDEGDPRRDVVLAVADPVGRGGVVIEGLAAAAREHAGDPFALLLLGEAAHAVGEFAISSRNFAEAAVPLRAQGRIALLVQALTMRAWDSIQLGDFVLADQLAEEANRLAEETAQPVWAAGSQLAQATVAAIRGAGEVTEELVSGAETVTVPAGLSAMIASGRLARGIAAIAEGRHQDAVDELAAMFDPGDVGFHHMDRFGGLGYLADAAVQSGERDRALRILVGVEPIRERTPSTGIRLALAYARAVLADDGAGEREIEAALAGEPGRMPFFAARLQLAQGIRLRRRRQTADSRRPLRAAMQTFEALGARAYAERARQELRASGETSRRRVPETRDELTPQETQIARLAASGLTNREIGEQLYLSPRTVSSHLYRVFPKLGITSRGQLAGALPPG